MKTATVRVNTSQIRMIDISCMPTHYGESSLWRTFKQASSLFKLNRKSQDNQE